MIEKIEPIPFPAASTEVLELTEFCRAEIERTFALPAECFLPPRSRPITINLTPLYLKKINELLVPSLSCR
jgi:hypothetical protein